MKNQSVLKPLSNLPAGNAGVLRDVNSGEALKARLSSMGLFPGSLVSVCQNDQYGPLVLRVQGGKIMLGRGMADKILVT